LSLAKHAKGAEKSKAPQAENRSNRFETEAPLRETLSLAKHAKGAEKSKAPQAENRSNRFETDAPLR
ncbi:MAG: hypothetical protein BWK80_43615, partial [Desulfobacteraceae bacterium IS3]